MWAVTHLCYILHAPCLFDYKLVGFICPQQTPFGTDRQTGQLLCWHCCQEVWKGTRVRGWLLHSQKVTNPVQTSPTQNSVCNIPLQNTPLGFVCITPLLQYKASAFGPPLPYSSGGRCRPHILPV